MKKFSYFYEIPLFFFLLYIFNIVFVPESPGFIDISPHPYWSGVLLFGFRYGSLAGFVSGVVAAAQFLALNYLFGESYLFDEMPFYAQPSLFIIIGTLVGTGIQRYRAIIRTLLRDKTVLNARERSLREELQTQSEIISELEKRIVTRMTTLVTLYEGARNLESVQLEELYPAILNFSVKTLEATQAALYLRQDDRFILTGSTGNGASPVASFLPGEGIAGYAAAHAKIATVRDFLAADEKEAEANVGLKDCLMAAPLRLGEQGEVIGVLCIRSMPFLNFNSATINLFSFLASWANRSLGRAFYIRSLKAQEILDPEFGTYSHSYFKSRSEEEFNRSKLYYLPLSLGLVRMEGLSSLAGRRRTAVLSAISQILKESCRSMDVVACYPEPDIPFAILLVTASQAQAVEIRDKIIANFSHLNLPPEVNLTIGLASFTPQAADFSHLIALARQEATHGKQSAA